MGVKKLIYGHHHQYYQSTITGEIEVFGVDKGGTIDLNGDVLIPQKRGDALCKLYQLDHQKQVGQASFSGKGENQISIIVSDFSLFSESSGSQKNPMRFVF